MDDDLGPLGFTWDSGLRLRVRAEGTDRALWRFQRMLPEYVFDAGNLEGNPFTYPEVQTLLEGVTVGGHKLSDERQILSLAEAARDLHGLVETGRFTLGKATSDHLQHLIARHEALETGCFRGEGSVITQISVYLGPDLGRYWPPETKPGGENLRRIYADGLDYILSLRDVFLQGAVYFLFGALMQLYYDGNKRTARYIANGWLMSHGIDAISIPAARREEFNARMIQFYAHKNGTDMIQFLASCWEDMQ